MTAAPPMVALHGPATLEIDPRRDPVVVVDDTPKLDTRAHLTEARAIAADARALLMDLSKEDGAP